MPTVHSVSQHAVERFMQRSGAMLSHEAADTVLKMARQALPYDRKSGKWLHGGWVFILKGTCVLTCYPRVKPTGWKKFRKGRRADRVDEND